MANKTAPPAAARPTALHDVPDKILRLILQLLVASPLCVVRAAATCKRWRRLVADARLVDSPSCRGPCPVAGSYRNDSLRGVVFAPSSSPDVVDGRHFSVDFLPGGSGSWELVDSRHGVLLLAKKNTWSSRRRRRCFPDLLVCEPIKRRYQLIPPMEQMKHHPCLGVFLYGCRDNRGYWGCNGARIPEFRVLCMLYQGYAGVPDDDAGTVVACVFDRFQICGRTAMHRKPGWWVKRSRALPWPYAAPPVHLHGAESLRFLGRAGSSLFWTVNGDEESYLCFNERDYYSLLWRNALPDLARWTSSSPAAPTLRFVDHGSDYGKARMICLQGSNLHIFVTVEWPVDDEWVFQGSLELAEATRRLAGYKEEYFCGGGALGIVAVDVRSVVLAPVLAPAPAKKKTWSFSVDLDTMEVAQCEDKTKNHAGVDVVEYIHASCHGRLTCALAKCVVRDMSGADVLVFVSAIECIGLFHSKQTVSVVS